MSNGRTELQKGTLTAQRYRDEISEPYMSLFRRVVGTQVIVIDNNVRNQDIQLADEYIETENDQSCRPENHTAGLECP
ncbi:hypothetical protein TNCV_2058741 [Trichonephila clavipes]|nr:hypothetical protein TNCV_2058741 [Trichonephila clavipes]